MLYLLRHGETEWNRIRRVQGQADSPLTPLGVKQAEACGRLLRSKISARTNVKLITSPLGRARATADIVRFCLRLSSADTIVENCLAELHYGQWQGLLAGEIDARYPGARAERRRNKWDYVIPGGESYAALASRLAPWIKRGNEEETSVVVTHDMVSRVVRGIYLNLEPTQVLALKHPQTRIYKLSHGNISQIDAPVESS